MQTNWHTLTAEAAMQQLQAGSAGLSSPEAARRLERFGSNSVSPVRRASLAKRILRQFHNPMIYVLLAALLVTAFLGHWTDSGVIAAVILLNALIGLIQEQKAENALAAIRRLLAPTANTLRDGKTQAIAAEYLVPGDVVMLTAGDKVPADLRLIEASSLRLQEAILTGESLDVEKSPESVAESTSLGERSSMAYSGTLVTAGQGKGIVAATGSNTEIGRISHLLGSVETPDTPLVRKLARFSLWLAAAVVVLSLLVFVFGVFIRGLAMDEMFMVMIAIAVSAIPEGLPAVISITLAVGVRAMARRNAIVRHLPVIEALGNATVICTDKTGTLTRNELAVTDIVTSSRRFHVTGVGYVPEGKILLDQAEIELDAYPVMQAMAQGAALNNDACLHCSEGIWQMNGDPTEGALITFALKAGQQQNPAEWQRAATLPFSAESRYMATLHHHEEGSVIYVKGAPEQLLGMCQFQLDGDGKKQPLDMNDWQVRTEALARDGKRVLAVARRSAISGKQQLEHKDVAGELTLLGLFGIMDTPRPEAKAAISACYQAGIAVKMITGDHALTASSIGTLLGIRNSEKVMTGSDIDKLSEEALAEAVEEVNIYARMHPEHKLRLVSALQAKGKVVAMTGDGVNDAPALKMADIGIAMGGCGTEVAKEASALVLADDNFATIVHAVEEGRNIFRNIRRTIQFMLVTDGCEALVLVLATFIGFALPVTPLQILWVNMVTSVTLSLSFAFAPYDPNAMQQPPRRLDAPIFSSREIGLFFVHVLIIAAGTISLFLHEWQSGDVERARTMAVNLLILFQVWYLWGLLLTQKHSATGFRAFLPLIVSTLAIMALQAAFTYHSWLQGIFATVPLSMTDWLTMNTIAASLLLWLLLESSFCSLKALLHKTPAPKIA